MIAQIGFTVKVIIAVESSNEARRRKRKDGKSLGEVAGEIDAGLKAAAMEIVSKGYNPGRSRDKLYRAPAEVPHYRRDSGGTKLFAR